MAELTRAQLHAILSWTVNPCKAVDIGLEQFRD
jgi:hypothetical protein